METLTIISSPFALDETTNEIEAAFSSIPVFQERVGQYRTRSLEHFEAKPIIDIVLTFVDVHKEFFKGAIYSISGAVFKEIVSKIWDGLKKNKPKGSRSSLEIKWEYADVKVSYKLEGNLSAEQIDKRSEAILTMIEKRQIITDTTNPDLHKDPINFDGVKYAFNEDSGVWVAHNYEEDRQKMYKIMRDLGH